MTAATTQPSAQPAAPPPSRAGRDLPMAIGVALVLAAVLILALWLHPAAFVAIICVAACVAVWELRGAMSQVGLNVPFLPVCAAVVIMLVEAYLRGPEALMVATGLGVLTVTVFRALDPTPGARGDIAAASLAILYPGLLASFAVMMLVDSQGTWRIVIFILMTVASDTGGYVAGVLFGKHPMAPSLSPKKSWEGMIGSLVGAGVVGSIGLAVLFDTKLWLWGLLLGMVVAVLATVGDLIESSIKRDVGVKDMSDLLPGHGGIMDRMDSLLVVVPVVWFALYILVPS